MPNALHILSIAATGPFTCSHALATARPAPPLRRDRAYPAGAARHLNQSPFAAPLAALCTSFIANDARPAHPRLSLATILGCGDIRGVSAVQMLVYRDPCDPCNPCNPNGIDSRGKPDSGRCEVGINHRLPCCGPDARVVWTFDMSCAVRPCSLDMSTAKDKSQLHMPSF